MTAREIRELRVERLAVQARASARRRRERERARRRAAQRARRAWQEASGG